MPHLHTEPGQHDHTISGFIVRTDLPEPKLILHKHKKLGRYIQFGGHIELHETPWQAITHELREESGYTMPQLSLLQPKQRITSLTGVKLHPVAIYHNTHNFDEVHFHTDLGYAFITDEEPIMAVEGNESNDMLLVSRHELVALPADQTFESVREAGLFIFDVCLSEWEVANLANFA
ncbi:MAG: NUDIX domain-containing protein [Candidatus Saccharimonadales bacterium]